MEQMTTLSWGYMPKQLDNLLIWWNNLWLDIRTYINIHNQVFARKHQFSNFVIHYWRFIGQNETVPSHNHHILRNITRFWDVLAFAKYSWFQVIWLHISFSRPLSWKQSPTIALHFHWAHCPLGKNWQSFRKFNFVSHYADWGREITLRGIPQYPIIEKSASVQSMALWYNQLVSIWK